MITIDWPNKIIHVPRADMGLIQMTPTEIRELPINWFRLQLKALEATPEGMPYPNTHNHNTEVSLGGLTYARMIEIINGYTITFEDGRYAVNLTGANSNIGDKVNVNQVSVRSANSAGMVSSKEMEYSVYNNCVTINVITGSAGSLHPIGSKLRPVNNLYDALIIASYRGFKRIYVQGSLTVETYNLSGFIIEGENAINTTLTLLDSAILEGTTVEEATVTGILDNNCILRNCMISGLKYFNGLLFQCALVDSIQLGGSGNAILLNCYGVSPNDQLVVIDANHTPCSLTLRNFSGCIQIKNRTVPTTSCINFTGYCMLDPTCTTGDFDMSGNGDLSDHTTGDAVVLKSKLVHTDEIVEATELALTSRIVENGYTNDDLIRLMASVLLGKVSGAETSTIKFRDLSDTKDRVVATVDTSGNRTTVTCDVQ